MLRPALLLPCVALDGLKFVDDVLSQSPGGFQLVHDGISDADGIAQSHALVNERLLQFLRLFLESVAVRLVGGLSGGLN